MEAVIRAILTGAGNEGDSEQGLFEALLDRFGECGGVDLELPSLAVRARAAELPE